MTMEPNHLKNCVSLMGSFDSPSRTRTYDSAVNSRVLYRLSYRGLFLFVPSKPAYSNHQSWETASFEALGQAFDRLVTVSYTHYCASTSALSTSCSSRGLLLANGNLILRGASRLDAFSVYPFRTWLLCHALGNTTDTPAVRPSRSSRTKDSSSQISCARAG